MLLARGPDCSQRGTGANLANEMFAFAQRALALRFHTYRKGPDACCAPMEFVFMLLVSRLTSQFRMPSHTPPELDETPLNIPQCRTAVGHTSRTGPERGSKGRIVFGSLSALNSLVLRIHGNLIDLRRMQQELTTGWMQRCRKRPIRRRKGWLDKHEFGLAVLSVFKSFRVSGLNAVIDSSPFLLALCSMFRAASVTRSVAGLVQLGRALTVPLTPCDFSTPRKTNGKAKVSRLAQRARPIRIGSGRLSRHELASELAMLQIGESPPKRFTRLHGATQWS